MAYDASRIVTPPAGEPDARRYWTELLQAHLAEAAALRRAARTEADAAQARVRLRSWQSARLARTHADLLGDAAFAPAARFFLDDLYGPKDCAERDAEVARIVPSLAKVLPVAGVHTLALALRMDALSEALDTALAGALRAAGRLASIDAAAYAAAYRASCDLAGREEQIRLVGEIGTTLAGLTRKPLLGLALHAFRGPAHLAGLGELHDFLQRGFDAFRHMKQPEEFIRRITTRERELMEALFAGRDAALDATA